MISDKRKQKQDAVTILAKKTNQNDVALIFMLFVFISISFGIMKNELVSFNGAFYIYMMLIIAILVMFFFRYAPNRVSK